MHTDSHSSASEAGIAHLGLIIFVALIIGVIGYAGIRVSHRNDSQNIANNQTTEDDSFFTNNNEDAGDDQVDKALTQSEAASTQAANEKDEAN